MSMTALLEKASVRKLIIPISVAQYHKMNEVEPVLTKTELIEGIIIEKMTKSPLHTYLLNLLYENLSRKLPANFMIRKEDPLTFATSEPEPDIAIVEGNVKDFKNTHPTHAELVIEIAISSLDLDREKMEIYAAAGIPEYWIVIPQEQRVEVYREPEARKYKTMAIYSRAESIPTVWGSVDLNTILD